MGTLTGLQIEINGKKKFIGKVGLCPANSVVPNLKGVCALYKEELWKDCISWKLDAFGLDADVWNKAAELGAQGILCYCADRCVLIAIRKEIVNRGYGVDLGEDVQVRIPLKDCTIYENVTKGLNFGWTENVITVKQEPKSFNPIQQPELF